MSKKPELKVVDFENDIGQTVRPGDEVIIVTTGYSHSVNTRKGVYLGRKGEQKGCSCRVVEYKMRYRHKTTGEELDSIHSLMPRYPSRKYGVRYGTPEYEEANREWNALYEKYQEECKAIRDQYEPFKVPYFRYTTLQRNRIYKLS